MDCAWMARECESRLVYDQQHRHTHQAFPFKVTEKSCFLPFLYTFPTYPSTGKSTEMLAERRSSPSPSPSRRISIGNRISAIGARLGRRSSNVDDSYNQNEGKDSISPIMSRTKNGECVHEICGGGGGTGSCWVDARIRDKR